MRIYTVNKKWEINKQPFGRWKIETKQRVEKNKNKIQVNCDQAGGEDDQQATSPLCYVTAYMSTCLFICDIYILILL